MRPPTPQTPRLGSHQRRGDGRALREADHLRPRDGLPHLSRWRLGAGSVSAARFGGSPRKEWIAFMQRLAGYLLTGETKEQKLFFFLGEGANGKGTWVEVVRSLLGTYAAVTLSTTFMRTRTDQHPTAVAD